MKRSILAWAGIACIATLTSVPLRAFRQSAGTSRLSFEVASVKPNPPGESRFDFREQPGGRLVATGISLKQLIGLAYRTRHFQLFGGPDWLNSALWTIEARAEANSSNGRTITSYLVEPDPTALRIQTLLEDQFQLKLHREMRELPLYELAIARNGPRIAVSTDQTPAPLDWQGSMLAFELAVGQIVPPPPPPPGERVPAPGSGIAPRFKGLMFVSRTEKGLKFEGNAIPLANLVLFLAQLLDRPVVDTTGLKGMYDLRFEWTPDLRPQTSAEPVSPGLEASGPSLFTAIQEQLGLRLVSSKGPIGVIVIDSAQKPAQE